MGFFSKIGFKSVEEVKSYIDQTLIANKLPDESLVEFALVQEKPSNWYFLLGGLIWAVLIKNHILIITSKRLLIVDVNAVNKPTSFTPFNLSEISLNKFSKGIISPEITILFPNNRKRKFTFAKLGGGKEKAQKIAEIISQQPAQNPPTTQVNSTLQTNPATPQETPLPQEHSQNPVVTAPAKKSRVLKIVLIIVLVIAILAVAYFAWGTFLYKKAENKFTACNKQFGQNLVQNAAKSQGTTIFQQSLDRNSSEMKNCINAIYESEPESSRELLKEIEEDAWLKFLKNTANQSNKPKP